MQKRCLVQPEKNIATSHGRLVFWFDNLLIFAAPSALQNTGRFIYRPVISEGASACPAHRPIFPPRAWRLFSL